MGRDDLVLADDGVPIVRPEICQRQVAHGPPHGVSRWGYHGAAQDIQLRLRLARQRDERLRVPVVPHDDLLILGDAQVELDRGRALELDRALTGLQRVLDRRGAGPPMAHDQELRGVYGEDPWRGGQGDVAEPHEATAEPLDDDQEALPQAWRREWCTRLTARVGSYALPYGVDGMM